MREQYPLLNRLKLRHLRLIIELEATHNLHRTAERMNLSQPSVTKLLQEIEYALKAPLFRRTSQGALPTALGEMVARHAQLMINDVIRLQHDVDAMRSGTAGMVRIGAIVAALPEHVSPIIARALDTHPQLSVSLTVGSSDTLLQALEAGRVDFIVARPSSTRISAQIEAHILSKEPLSIVAAPRHPLADESLLELAALGDARWILPETHSPLRRAIDATFALARLPPPRQPIEASSIIASLDLLQHSAMLAFMPTSIAQMFEQAQMIRRLHVQLDDHLGCYSLITLKERPLSAAARFLTDAIKTGLIRNSDQTLTS